MIGFSRKLIGLYIGARRMQVTAVEKSGFHWKPMAIDWDSAAGGPPGGESDLHALRELLRRVPPRAGLAWYLALPRSGFFFRDLSLPAMPLEDALLSVQSMVHILVHLPIEEVYYDVQLSRKPDRTIRAMLVYAPRKKIDPFRDIFRDAGHESRLKAIFPLSVGIGAYLSLKRHDFPLALEIGYNDGREIAVYDELGCRGTFYARNGGQESIAGFRQSVGVSPDRLFSLDGTDGTTVLPEVDPNPLPVLPDIQDNLAAAALASGLSAQQVISVDDTPTRLRLFPFWKTVGAAVALLVLACGIWTGLAFRKIDHNKVRLAQLREHHNQLEQQVRPLERNRQSAEHAKQMIADMDEFLNHRAGTFRLINNIAELVPEGTWFSRFTFSEKEITVQGQSKDAIKALEALRTSAFLDQVKLTGSVMKAPNGLEQFTMTMKLKEEKLGEHEPTEPAHQ
ncbi:PilN domain-containing protein [Desulfatirhabdium butyrativorans]|uniref:PilN domain-containing protein n=1 Tax=Desulfatirhabdium butyrativorans TaxID=340467 RepID=UPI00040BD3B4|nr:PilN domain-containing protein [Desulfatirhabdium butyrativorans]